MKYDPDSDSLPARSQLPHVPGTPQDSAWFWGENDELGRLNLLTPRRKAAAASLIKDGITIGLNWSAELPFPPMFGREPLLHQIKPLGPAGNDEILKMNSQSGSQWDGFRHVSVPHEGSWVFYNNTTPEQIEKTTECGVQAWAAQGIVGRGVLLDYWSYAKESYDVNSRHPISAKDLKACAMAQGTQFEYGDILIIRTGWIDAYNKMTQDERVKLTEVPAYSYTFVGVDQHPDVADFLHDNYFSVVASDSPVFEVWPQIKEWNHHVNLLPKWGVPIGELWDLERLAEVCQQRKQWAFFFASTPNNIKGSVGSPSNALAMF